MRVNDIIISADGRGYDVEKIDIDQVKARAQGPHGRLKTFDAERLFCIDHNQGLYQETKEER